MDFETADCRSEGVLRRARLLLLGSLRLARIQTLHRNSTADHDLNRTAVPDRRDSHRILVVTRCLRLEPEAIINRVRPIQQLNPMWLLTEALSKPRLP
jgi:hypothetical protein